MLDHRPIRSPRVLLIQPPYRRSYFAAERYLPLGLGYLAETLEQHDVEYDVLDMALGYGTDDLLSKIRQFEPDLLGCSMISYDYKAAYALFERVKRDFPSMTIMVGGPHVSTFRNEVLEDCPSIDYGVVLEGERTLIEVLQGQPLRDIKGLLYRQDDGQIVFNGEREFIRNLDKIPFPRFRKFEFGKYKARFGDEPGTINICIITSRGCPSKCIYCPTKAAIGRRFRARSAKNVADELEYWYSRGYERFTFQDDNFTLIADRVYDICDEIEKRKLKIKFSLGSGIRADRVDFALLKRMKEVGCDRISFGVEAGNDKILKVLKKGEKLEVIERALKDSCDLGYEVRATFLVGSPTETWEDIEDSAKLALKYPLTSVGFFNLVPFPATELFRYIEETPGCYFTKESKDYLDKYGNLDRVPLFVTPELSYEDRVKALRYTRTVSKKVLSRALYRRYPRYAWFLKLGEPIIYSDWVRLTLARTWPYQKTSAYVKRILRDCRNDVVHNDR